MTTKILNILQNEKLNEFLEKYGAYSGIISTFIAVIMLIVGTILHSLTEPMNMFTHWISNIGAGYNGSSEVFSILLITTVIVEIPFILDLFRRLMLENEEGGLLSVFTLIISLIVIIGALGVALFNLKDFPLQHVISAIAFFMGSMLMMLSFSIAILKSSNFPKSQAIVGFIGTVIFLIFLLTFVPFLLMGRDLVSLITGMGPELSLTRFWEWMSLFGLLFWSLETGIYLLRSK